MTDRLVIDEFIIGRTGGAARHALLICSEVSLRRYDGTSKEPGPGYYLM